AIRHWLRNFPPRIVSRKCTCQVSPELTLPMAAAMPPSAITVCALPNSDLQITAVRAPRSRASMAARRPAPPAPTTTTSHSCRSTTVIPQRPSHRKPSETRTPSEEARIVEDAGGDEIHVEVGERHAQQRGPGQLHVAGVQAPHPLPHPVAHRMPGEVLQLPADDVPAGVAGDRVQPDQHDVGQEAERAEPHVAPRVV